MKRFCLKTKEYLPLFSVVMVILALISAIFYIIVLSSTKFADFFNYNLSSIARQIMAWSTTWIPFSIAELLIIISPIWIGLLIFLAVKYGKRGLKPTVRYLSVIISILLYIFITFVWTYSSGFHTTTIDKQLELDKESVTDADVYSTTIKIIDILNSLANEVNYDENGSSTLPYSYRKLSAKICDAYKAYEKKHGVIKTFKSQIKPIILSEPMTYTHISGVYTFMTGEGNVNTNYPDFIVTTSAAHELSHQRGVAREDEANFTAFAVLINSDDAFLKYSAYLDVFMTVSNQLYQIDKEKYKEALSMLDMRIKGDLAYYSEFFEKYADSKASDISDKINDSYLQANGQENGTKSYNMIVELTCAYMKKYL